MSRIELCCKSLLENCYRNFSKVIHKQMVLSVTYWQTIILAIKNTPKQLSTTRITRKTSLTKFKTYKDI